MSQQTSATYTAGDEGKGCAIMARMIQNDEEFG